MAVVQRLAMAHFAFILVHIFGFPYILVLKKIQILMYRSRSSYSSYTQRVSWIGTLGSRRQIHRSRHTRGAAVGHGRPRRSVGAKSTRTCSLHVGLDAQAACGVSRAVVGDNTRGFDAGGANDACRAARWGVGGCDWLGNTRWRDETWWFMDNFKFEIVKKTIFFSKIKRFIWQKIEI